MNNKETDFHFSSQTPIAIKFDAESEFTAKFDTGTGGTSKVVVYGTTEYWNSQPELISKKGVIYIYADWYEDPEHGTIAGFKVGDGTTPLIQISATDTMWLEHVHDVLKHVSPEDRIRWDNKVTLDYYEHIEQIIFSK